MTLVAEQSFSWCWAQRPWSALVGYVVDRSTARLERKE